MNSEEQSKKYGQLVAKCWTDEGFKAKLMANPAAVLKAEGLDLPAGTSINVVENTNKVFNVFIPAKPVELTDEQLDTVAGGLCSCFSVPL